MPPSSVGIATCTPSLGTDPQDEYDCYFLIANMHAFTIRAEDPEAIWHDEPTWDRL